MRDQILQINNKFENPNVKKTCYLDFKIHLKLVILIFVLISTLPPNDQLK